MNIKTNLNINFVIENICLIWKNQAVSKLNDELYFFLQEENKRKRKIQRKGFLLIFILLNVDLSKMRNVFFFWYKV